MTWGGGWFRCWVLDDMEEWMIVLSVIGLIVVVTVVVIGVVNFFNKSEDKE